MTEKLERNRGSGIFLRTDEFINPPEWIKCKISLFVLLVWVWFPLLQDLLHSITLGYGNYLYWTGNWVDLREPCRGYTKGEAQVSIWSAFNTCYKLPVHFSCSLKQAWPDLCLEVILTDTTFWALTMSSELCQGFTYIETATWGENYYLHFKVKYAEVDRHWATGMGTKSATKSSLPDPQLVNLTILFPWNHVRFTSVHLKTNLISMHQTFSFK